MLAAGMAKRYGGCKPLAPLGIHGEAIIDLTASDALAAGFGRIVLVVGPTTSPAITLSRRAILAAMGRHGRPRSNPCRSGPRTLFSARGSVSATGPFAVVNSDDVYGVRGLRLLAETLARGANALVAFRLAETVLTGEPVTRGVCVTDGAGKLIGLAERRKVTRHDGRDVHRRRRARAVAARSGCSRVDEPVGLPTRDLGPSRGCGHRASTPTSARRPDRRPGARGSRDDERDTASRGRRRCRVGRDRSRWRSSRVPDDASGVTHADDLPVARAAIARMVGRGERAEWLWERPR